MDQKQKPGCSPPKYWAIHFSEIWETMVNPVHKYGRLFSLKLYWTFVTLTTNIYEIFFDVNYIVYLYTKLSHLYWYILYLHTLITQLHQNSHTIEILMYSKCFKRKVKNHSKIANSENTHKSKTSQFNFIQDLWGVGSGAWYTSGTK